MTCTSRWWPSRTRRAGSAAVAAFAALLAAAAAAGAHTPAGQHPGHRPAAQPISLAWVGDIALSSERGLPPGGLDAALAPVAPALRSPDLTAGNLEGTLSAGGSSKCGAGDGGGDCFAFQAPPAYAQEIHELGFDVVNQANNHSMDDGPTGRAQTVAALNHAGVAHTGFPGQITVVRTHGEKVAFLGFAPYPYDADLLDIPGAVKLVHAARRRARIVVVIIHAGAEGADQTHTPPGDQSFLGEDRGNARAFAHAVVNAGASLVLGSGPHVIRGIERYHGHLVAYSLGNFVGYHTLAGGGVLDESAILHVTLAPNGRLTAARWQAVRLVNGLPRLDPAQASTHLVQALSRADFPGDHFSIGPRGIFRLGG